MFAGCYSELEWTFQKGFENASKCGKTIHSEVNTTTRQKGKKKFKVESLTVTSRITLINANGKQKSIATLSF